MSYVARATTIRFQFQDNDGARAFFECKLAPSVSLSDASSYMLALAPIVQSVSTATCIGADIIAHLEENSLLTPETGSDVRNLGVFLFSDGSGNMEGIRFAGFDTSLTLSSGAWSGIAIDLDDTDVASLVSALVSGLSGTEPCDAFGADIATLEAALVETLP